MQNLPNHVQVHYKQELDPFKVQETLAGYDAMILLTTGENFGHALFENMSIGRPVITSYFTPWNELQLKKAGWNVNISLPGTITALLDELAKKDTTEWEQFCRQAHAVASNYFNGQGLPEKYKQLFC
jgi:glycosyltransferase involved in cell wall biosynthesis